jgi:hypothetical protein
MRPGIRLNAIEFGGWSGQAPPPRLRIAYRLEADDYRGGDAVQLVVVHREPAEPRWRRRWIDDLAGLAEDRMAADRHPPYNSSFDFKAVPMIELNPVRQRIADLRGRLHSLRGFL